MMADDIDRLEVGRGLAKLRADLMALHKNSDITADQITQFSWLIDDVADTIRSLREEVRSAQITLLQKIIHWAECEGPLSVNDIKAFWPDNAPNPSPSSTSVT